MSETVERLSFHKTDDGRAVLLGEWPERIAVSDGFVEALPDVVRAEGDVIVFTLANGSARYRRIGLHSYRAVEYLRVGE